MILIIVVFGTLLIRFIQRLYFFLKGHILLSFQYSPNSQAKEFLRSINANRFEFISKTKSGQKFEYYRIGKGKIIVYACNGVGSGFFVLHPMLKNLLRVDPNIFDKITVIAPSYRGLFGSTNVDEQAKIEISMVNCASDIDDILSHAKIDKIDVLLCWSLGVQVAMNYLESRSQKVSKLFFLNPSTGETLHTALQPFFPLPKFLGNFVSRFIVYSLSTLREVVETNLWSTLRLISRHFLFRIVLELVSFIGGFAPEFGGVSDDYVRDIFSSRNQTRGLIDLVLSLDAPCPLQSLKSFHNDVTILSGLPDTMTGVYHAYYLTKLMPQSRHVVFTMASHFLLIEWPELVAEEFIYLLGI